MKAAFWSFIHNVIAHPLVAVAMVVQGVSTAFVMAIEWFHDWTAEKM